MVQTHSTTTHRLQGHVLWGGRFLAWGVVAAAIFYFFVAVFTQVQMLRQVTLDDLFPGTQLDLPATIISAYFLTLDTFSFLTFAGVAVLLLWQRSHNWMAMLTAVMLATFGGILANGTAITLFESRASSWQVLFLSLAVVGHVTFVFFIYTFPDGRFRPPWLVIPAVLGMIWFVATTIFVPFWEMQTGLTTGVSFVVYAISMSSVGYRLNAANSSPAMVQQAKWVSTGLGIALLGYVVISFPPIFFPVLSEPGLPNVIYFLLARLFVIASLITVPVTIGFSILRYRLWDVDVVINRSLVYGGLTIFLALFLILDLLIFQWLFTVITGRDQATVALVVASVITGSAFQPLRRRLQRFVDRRLYGIQLDYEQVKPVETAVVSPSSQTTHIGPYELLDMVGRGGMAEVHKGRHPTLNRTVAIKIMLTDQARDPDFRARFEREAQAMAHLRHANIIEIFDFGEVDGSYYMVMEFVDGPDLSDYIQQRRQIPLAEALPLLADLAAALDYAHALDLVHRDIKPSNVMLQRATTAAGQRFGYQAILTDFGIAKMRGTGSNLTRTGMVGTLDYIAPEQIKDAKTVDGRADVYSLGVLAYQMLTGVLPFTGSNPGAILMGHLMQPPPDARMVLPDLPEGAALAMMQALAKEPRDRFETAGAFVQAMTREP